MTAQLSRKRLEEKLLEHIKHGGDSEEETMIRMLLAGMDSKPLAVPDVATPETVQALSGVQACFAGGWAYLDESQREIASDVWNACRAAMLKAAPPAPVALPDERAAFNVWNNEDNLPIAGVGAKNAAWLAWQARAAILNAGPVTAAKVPEGWKLVPVEPTAEMISSGITAHYERSQIQIHDRPAPGPMECGYLAMLAAAPAAPEQEV